jgi:hypothetical protein
VDRRLSQAFEARQNAGPIAKLNAFCVALADHFDRCRIGARPPPPGVLRRSNRASRTQGKLVHVVAQVRAEAASAHRVNGHIQRVPRPDATYYD